MRPPKLPIRFGKKRRRPLWREPPWWHWDRLKQQIVPVAMLANALMGIAEKAWAWLGS